MTESNSPHALELTSLLFRQIAGEAPPAVKEDDRRRSPRLPLLSRAVIYPDEDGIGHSTVVVMRDVSIHGVGFNARERMAVGDKFILQLPRRGAEPIMLVCGVTRCWAAASDHYVIGATFLRISEPEVSRAGLSLPAVSIAA